MNIDFNEMNTCPEKMSKKNSGGICEPLCKKNYPISLGWGKLTANIIFISINPGKGKPCKKEDRITVAINNSKMDWSNEQSGKRFFSFHKQIFGEVRNQNYQDINLIEEAFFAEMILCPGDYKELENFEETAVYCSKLYLKRFLEKSKAKIIIVLGKGLQNIIKEVFKISELEPLTIQRPVIQSEFKLNNKSYTLIWSYHPNGFRIKGLRNNAIKQIAKLISIIDLTHAHNRY